MFHTFLTPCFTGLGCVLLCLSSFHPQGVSLTQETLASYQGGLVYCAAIMQDSEAIDCPECEDIVPKAKSRQCTTTETNETWTYVKNQNPAQRYEEVSTNCGGDLWDWSALGCTGTLTVTKNGCFRTYKKWNFDANDPKATCP